MKSEAIEIIYSVEVDDLTVEAITIHDVHEYRIRKGQRVLFQSDDGYGQTGIALRDGLIKAPDPPWDRGRRLPAARQWRVVSFTRCSAVAASRLSRAAPILSTSRTNQRTSVRSDETSAIAVVAAPASAEPRANAMVIIVSGDIA